MGTHQLVFVVGAVLAVMAGPTRADDLPPDTLERKDEILRRFHEEFVSLAPRKATSPVVFKMGSALGPENEGPEHVVSFSGDFAIAKYEVTQEVYFVVAGSNPARWRGPRNSVEMINWHEAKDFCTKVTMELRRLKLLAGEEIRLPSEAEWEYACRAGTTTAYSFGDNAAELGKYSWYKDNAPGNDPPVGRKLPNAWGLFDMHGYVWEWCADSGHANYKNAPVDGSPWLDPASSTRMIRGGSYADAAEDVRSASRRAVSADHRSPAVGFRCVRAKSK